MFSKDTLIRFFISGITTALVQLSVLFLLTDILEIYYITSSILAFLVALLTSFNLQKRWTFKNSSSDQGKQFIVYSVTAIVNLILNTALMYLFVDIFNIWYMLSQVIVFGIIAVESFLIYRFIIFKEEV